MKLQISERDKKLLFILAMCFLLFGAYYFGYLNLVEATDKLTEDTRDLNKRYSELAINYAKKDDMIKDTEEFAKTYENILSMFANGTSQDNAIVFLSSVEENTGVWFKQIGLSTTNKIYTFGNVQSSNPSSVGANVYSSDLVGHKTTYTASFEASYENWKDTIEYLNNNESKCTIETMSVTYDKVEDIVSGTLTLSMYDITGSKREFPRAILKNVAIGTPNIFYSSTFYPAMTLDKATGANIINNYDLYIILNSSASDMDSIVMGQANDALNKKVLSTTDNSVVSAYVYVTGTDGNYKVSYKLGNVTYPETDYLSGDTLNCGETLDMLIISSKRSSDDDKSGVKLNVVNESDKELNIKVLNEDNDNPRFAIESTTGGVNVYE